MSRAPALITALMLAAGAAAAQPTTQFTIARVHYDGGGDWYSDPSSLPNLLAFVGAHTRIRVADTEARVRLDDEELYNYPYLYLTGHGNISFSARETARLRAYLEAGGFLHADDNYGMDESFRREMKKVFPTRDFVELPADHDLFHSHFDLPDGLPKVHEHNGKRPQALGLFQQQRLIVVYTYESDLGDGWEDAPVHGVPEATRQAALRMGTNIIVHSLIR
ncbi:MAG: DUF4159 domain-containing protein [bacterium]|nr:DUF4159 domain-containing protein [bacterium]